MGITTRLQALASDEPGSLSRKLRDRRFTAFEDFAAQLPSPLRIVDLGGTNEYWERRGWAGRKNVHITLVNLEQVEQRHENIVPTVGDAMKVDADDNSYDLAFSNSVIEHLFTIYNQWAMASEIKRLAPCYWVQTPNWWFPIEPHFLVPAWHWLSEDLRVEILVRRGVGWAGKCDSREHAERVVQEHRLMTQHELARMFPGATLIPEKVGGLVKSWTAARVSATPEQVWPGVSRR